MVKGFMALLVLSFSIWGIGDIFRGNALQKTVASVGDEKIDIQKARQLFDQLLSTARQNFDPNLTAQQAKQLGLLEKAVGDEIKRIQVDTNIKQLGIRIPPEEVIKFLSSLPQFRTPDGKLDKQMFARLLQQQRMSEAAFMQQEGTEIARSALFETIAATNFIPKTVSDEIYKAAAQKRILDVVVIDSNKIDGIKLPSDEELHAFYDKNQQRFMAPEYRSMTVASLSVDEIAKNMSVSEEELRKAYDEKREDFAVPEKRELIQVVTQDEAKAKKIYEKASARGDLVFAAKEFGEASVPLGLMADKDIMPELSKPIFAAKSGNIINPVKTQLGWHIVQVKNVYPAAVPEFEKIKSSLKEELIKDKAIESSTDIANKIDDNLAAGHEIEDFADDLRLRLNKLPAVDVNGKDPDGKAVNADGFVSDAMKYAFEQNAGETSPIQDNKNGIYYVVRTDNSTPAGVRPYDAVKKDVASAWKAEEQMKIAGEKAKSIESELKKGAKLASFANGRDISVRTSAPLSDLGDIDKTLPQDLLAMAFKIKKGETTIVASQDKQYVGRLSTIIPADLSKDDSKRKLLVVELRKQVKDELIDQYVGYLNTLLPAEIDVQAMDALRQQEN